MSPLHVQQHLIIPMSPTDVSYPRPVPPCLSAGNAIHPPSAQARSLWSQVLSHLCHICPQTCWPSFERILELDHFSSPPWPAPGSPIPIISWKITVAPSCSLYFFPLPARLFLPAISCDSIRLVRSCPSSARKLSMLSLEKNVESLQ